MPTPEDKGDNLDKKPDTPQRLQGLSSRGGRGSLRGGRFLPNAVGRRSREERESSAPAIKPNNSDSQEPNDRNKMSTRSKFDRRKHRQLGTRAEAAGPLAAPNIAASAGTSRVPRSTGSSGSTVSSISERSDAAGSGIHRVKTERSSAFTSLPDERIDMASGGNGEPYFPLRMPSDAVASDSPSQDHSAADAIASVRAEESRAYPEAPGESEAKLEQDISSHDHLNIENGDLYLLQLPHLGLSARKAPANSLLHSAIFAQHSDTELKVKDENVEMIDVIETEGANSGVSSEKHDTELNDANVLSGSGDGDELLDPPTGLLGTLRKHASGKLTMVIGNSVYEVLKGTHGASLENLVLFNETKKQVSPVGKVKSRVLVIPDLDSLHI